jgi:hypothetical protein
MFTRCALVLTIAMAGLAGTALAQEPSLAEVARKEGERRKTVATPAKVYTNADVRPVLAPSRPVPAPPAPDQAAATPAAAPAGQSEGAAGAGTGIDAATADEPKAGEAEWRKRITDAREQLQRSTLFRDALQSRINGLTTDFVARDDPHQRAEVARQRQEALAELDRVNKEIEAGTRLVADIEDAARREGIPPGWLR